MPNFEIINQSDNPNVGRNKINYNFSILSGAGFSIGGLVSGGTPTQVLYTDDNGNLFSDSGFTRDSSFSATNINTGNYFANEVFGLGIGNTVSPGLSSVLYGFDSSSNYVNIAGVINNFTYLTDNSSNLIFINQDTGIAALASAGNISSEPILNLYVGSLNSPLSASNIQLFQSGMDLTWYDLSGNTNSININNSGLSLSVSGVSWNWMKQDGASGQIIATDGNGNLFFKSQGANASIGDIVSGGTPTQVLYTDDNGNLFSDSGFTRDSSFSATTILTNDYYLDKQFGLIIGEYGGLSGASIFEINTDSNTGNIIGINESLSQDGSPVSFMLSQNSDSGSLSLISVGSFSGYPDIKLSTTAGSNSASTMNMSMNGVYINSTDGNFYGEMGVDSNHSYLGYKNSSGGTSSSFFASGSTRFSNSGSSAFITSNGTTWEWAGFDGSNGDVITTDGQGNLSFKPVDGLYTSTTVSGSYTLDASIYNTSTINLENNSNLNLNLINFVGGSSGNIIFKQNTSGNSTVTLTGTSYNNYVVNEESGIINLTQLPNAIDIVSFISDGGNIYWSPGYNYT